MAKIKHLTEYHRRAMEMKYRGNSYQDIAERLNEYADKSMVSRKFKMQTIKDWFKENGALAEAYRLYEQEMDGIHREILRKLAPGSVRRISGWPTKCSSHLWEAKTIM